MLVFGLIQLLLALEESFAVLVKLKVSDHAVGSVDGNLDGGACRSVSEGLSLTVCLLPGDFLDMDAVAPTVDGLDLAVAALQGAPNDFDIVSLADGDGSHVVLGLQVFGEVASHVSAACAGGRGEVGLAGLPPAA